MAGSSEGISEAGSSEGITLAIGIVGGLACLAFGGFLAVSHCTARGGQSLQHSIKSSDSKNLPDGPATSQTGDTDDSYVLEICMHPLDEQKHERPSFERQWSDACVSSLASLKRPYVRIDKCSQIMFRATALAELCRWELPSDGGGPDGYFGVVQGIAQLMCEANAGALVIIAPKQDLEKLHFETTDSGYLTKRLRGLSVHSDEFRRVFGDFAAHSENDCWPSDYHDQAARGLPKDGALLVLPTGLSLKSAVKIIGLPLAPSQWAGHGTRHETALSVAAYLDQALVLVHSSSGHMHCLLARDRGNIALSLEFQDLP